MQKKESFVKFEWYRLKRFVAFSALVLAPAISTPSMESDPLDQLDENMIGAAITKHCRPGFNWDKHMQSADALGRKAYDIFVRDFRAKYPHDPNNEIRADRALRLRMEEMLRKGEQIVSEKGGEDLDIQKRLQKFGSF